MYAGSHVCWCIHVLVDEICIRNLPVIPPYSLRQSLPRIKTFWIQLSWLASLLCLTRLSAGITGSLLHLSTILPGFCGSKVWFSTLAWACPRFEVFGSTYIVPKWHKIILMPIIEHLKLMFSPLVLHIQMTCKISQEFEDFWGKDVESFWFWVCWCVHFPCHTRNEGKLLAAGWLRTGGLYWYLVRAWLLQCSVCASCLLFMSLGDLLRNIGK